MDTELSRCGPALGVLPPVDWWPLAWVVPVPWVLLIRIKELSGRRPYTVFTLAGFCFWMAALHWLRLPHPATSIGWVALSFYFAFYLPVFVGLSRVAVHRLRVPVVLAAPIIWTGLELARAHLLTGMSMASLGHTQYRWIGLIQLSDLTGAYGVSFVVMFVAASLARMRRCRRQPPPHYNGGAFDEYLRSSGRSYRRRPCWALADLWARADGSRFCQARAADRPDPGLHRHRDARRRRCDGSPARPHPCGDDDLSRQAVEQNSGHQSGGLAGDDVSFSRW